MKTNQDLSLTGSGYPLNKVQKLLSSAFSAGLLLLIFTALHPQPPHFLGILGSVFFLGGSIAYAIYTPLIKSPGIQNNGVFFSSLSNRGLWGWVSALLLSGFYITYYWFPHLLTGLYRLMDPLSYALRGEPTQSWFAYGTLYTLAVLIMGLRALLKYRHSNYQVIRTLVVMSVQFVLSWFIPGILVLFKQPEKYLNYSWPLSWKDFYPQNLLPLFDANAPKLAAVLGIYGLAFTFVLTPVLTYYYGKRWYCSWVCGCGGLANTLGDPWRHLSSKSERAWKIERISIYFVLVFISITTLGVWISYLTGSINGFTTSLTKTYGFLIGMIFSGVIGTGFYPLFGTRLWCRFGCPQAAILGILQKVFSRFRITTNGGQCISCGNCSTYCEMGIDVRSYAQMGKNIIRASCVGCGICSAVCPRGVLNLENGPSDLRYNKAQESITKPSAESVYFKPSIQELWNKKP